MRIEIEKRKMNIKKTIKSNPYFINIKKALYGAFFISKNHYPFFF